METKLVSLLNQFVNMYQPQEIFILKFPSPTQQKSSAVQICASGDSSVLRITLEGQSLMRSAMSQLQLSARAYHRILKLSRTIADLAASEEIQSAHLAEALKYRPEIMMG